jgi:hypothetical protein
MSHALLPDRRLQWLRGSLMGLLTICGMMQSQLARGADAYFVRFRANGKAAVCNAVLWQDTVLLYNAGTTPATVRMLGISNGAPGRTMPDTCECAAGSSP